MAREGLNPETAFQRLRRQARASSRRMVEVAAEVIEQAHDTSAAVRAREGVAGSARRLAELEQVATGFAAARTTTTVARLVTERGLRALDAQAGLVGLITDDGQALELVAWAGYPVQAVTPWRRIPLQIPRPLTEAAQDGKTILLSTTAEFQARYPDVDLLDGYQARAAVGLVVEGRPAGALGFSFTQARTFDEVDRRFIQALASHCAQALERVRLTEQARAARTKLATAQARALSAERAAMAAQANAVRAREQAGRAPPGRLVPAPPPAPRRHHPPPHGRPRGPGRRRHPGQAGRPWPDRPHRRPPGHGRRAGRAAAAAGAGKPGRPAPDRPGRRAP
jgi:transcriptional regulator with GAF, ATPase, and Fis domain